MMHLSHPHDEYVAVPLCGAAMWDGLTSNPDRNECWECASIAGAYSPELQARFDVNADGTERQHGDTDADVLYALNDAIAQAAADWGLLDRFDGDDKDDTLNNAVHAAFNILTGRTET